MEYGHGPAAVPGIPISPKLGDPRFPQNGFGRGITRQKHNRRIDQADNLHEVRLVIFYLLRSGLSQGATSVTGRQSKDGVGDEHVTCRIKFGGRKDLVE